MRILVGIWNPPHVHFFKNMVWSLQKDGHEVKIVARQKEMTIQLLDAYKFDYELCGVHKKTFFSKILNAIKIERKLYRIAKEFKPDILTGILDMYSAHVGWALQKHSLIFTDSEPVPFVNFATFPFASTITTPYGYKLKLPNDKHVRFNGYKELAYLHPNWFEPNPDVLDMLGVSKEEKYVILRFNAFDASHDIGIKGFSLDDKRRLVKGLEKYARVFISSEVKLPDDLEKYAMKMPPHRMHDALYYASLLVGDTQTSTTESACLGTPAIRCNSFVGPNDMSNFIELEQKHGLIFNYREPKKAIEKAIELIQQPNLKKEWQKKREKLLKDKIDVTAFMTWFIEDYPESFKTMKENPDYPERFK